MKSILRFPCLLTIAALTSGAPFTSFGQTAAPAAPTGPATSAPATSEAKSAPAAAAKKIEYQGSITAISADGESVTVKTKDASMTLGIDAATKILKDKKPAKLTDFAVGDKVTGSYTKEAAGKTVAASLHKKTEAAAPRTPAAGKEKAAIEKK